MFLSVGRRLRRGFSYRLGFRVSGPAAAGLALFVAVFYMMWWTLLCAAYLLWGCIWLTWQVCKYIILGLWWACKLIFWYPFKGLAKLFHRKRPEA